MEAVASNLEFCIAPIDYNYKIHKMKQRLNYAKRAPDVLKAMLKLETYVF